MLKFDATDKKAMYLSVRKPHTIEGNKVLSLMLFPFMQKHYLSKLTNGDIYNNYILLRDGKLADRMRSKIFWMYTLKKYDIPHSELIANCTETHCNVYHDIEKNVEYTEQDEVGDLQSSIYGNDIVMKPGINKVWIKKEDIQQLFRIVTLHDHILSIWNLNENKKLEKLKWNKHNNEFECYSNCNIEEMGEITNILEMANKLLEIHKKEFPEVFSIGWDIIKNKNGDIKILNCNTSPLSHHNDEIIDNFKTHLHKSEFQFTL